eukprot:CAMPEP_0197673404 /NCGR_PEP_ID=MMETSP1338-20131121/80867_1 /TAXON_ID=43686 ORGANISM="Pelagodinium beii, Strain RCC1491" /NCGR_SAMPLE_ID=MMETSP1338 /ASSEMBLY_ACC=CAM_ASM_000754 /LENGTH=78 /DNA_ID=CAMNT_0043253647 /DNA_START=65 /DNA_END=298 /DNA_ORIENTATION=+
MASNKKITLTPYVGNPARATPDRCKQRWNDLAFLRMEGRDSRWVTSGNGVLMSHALRERFILFLNCIESKPGQEPTQP